MSEMDMRICDLMTTAIEGGSAYWMNEEDDVRRIKVERDGESNVTRITGQTDTDGKGWVPFDLNATNVLVAINKLKDDEALPAHIRQMAASFLVDPDYDYDADDADTIIQYAIFNDIVFG